MRQFRLLCYGDSNTWGYQSGSKERFNELERYPMLLQNLLGNRFIVIEDGLNGRTSGLPDSIRPETNARNNIIPCLNSHPPIDAILLMLGTNELKTRFHCSPEDICNSIEALIQTIQNVLCKESSDTKIILVAPRSVDSRIIKDPEFDLCAVEKSKKLPSLLKTYAQNENLLFVNTNDYSLPLGNDGCHFSKEAHKTLASLLADKVLNWFAITP